MTHRLSAAALLSLAGTVAAQTPSVHLEFTSKGMPSGQNGLILGFDTYAQLAIAARIEPPVGTPITLPNGTPGTIAGLGAIWFDLIACDAASSQWQLTGTGFQGTTGTNWGIRTGWTTGSSAGTVQPDRSLFNISAGQFILPGQTANATNPVADIWRGRWTPASFASGATTRFTIAPHSVSILVRTGTLPGGEPVYVSAQANAEPTAGHVIIDTGPPPPCMPFYGLTPSIISLTPGDTAMLNVAVSTSPGKCPPWQYQWRRVCNPLSNDSRTSGAQSSTLRISPVTEADAGFYNVVVNGLRWGGTIRLKVSGCYVNCDRSTSTPTLTPNDFQCFLNMFAAGDGYANCDLSSGSPTLTANDFQCFLNKYASGCS